MPQRRRFSLRHPAPRWLSWTLGLFVTASLFSFAIGCDQSGGGPPPSDLEGTYVFTQFEFTVAGVDDFNLLADTLVVSSLSPRLEFFAGNARANLVYQLEGNTGSSFLPARFTTGPSRVTLDLNDAPAEDRFQLLLPTVVRFSLPEGETVLEARQEVENVDLRSYAPERYAGLTQPVNGTLLIRLERQ